MIKDFLSFSNKTCRRLLEDFFKNTGRVSILKPTKALNTSFLNARNTVQILQKKIGMIIRCANIVADELYLQRCIKFRYSNDKVCSIRTQVFILGLSFFQLFLFSLVEIVE